MSDHGEEYLTLIARFGDEGHEYASGWAKFHTSMVELDLTSPLHEAYKRLIERKKNEQQNSGRLPPT